MRPPSRSRLRHWAATCALVRNGQRHWKSPLPILWGDRGAGPSGATAMTGRSAVARRTARRDLVAKVEAAQRVLEERIEALTSGADWCRYLGFQSKLHQYSPNNVMLIWAQHAAAFADGRVGAPEPSVVAGYRTWQALGRQVERGQRGYAVLAPMVVRRRVAVGDSGDSRPLEAGEAPTDGESELLRTALRGFRIEHVFDVSQTSGQELPEPVVPELLTGEAPTGLRAAVQNLIEGQGFRVESVPSASALAGANGVTEWSSARVRVRADMDDAAQVKTLIHEAGHVLLHRSPAARSMSRSQKEVEAESVAYIVAAAHGMTTDDYSFPYVMTWAGADGTSAVRAAQARIAGAALRIIECSPAAHVNGGRPSGVNLAADPPARHPGIGPTTAQVTVSC